MTFVEALAILGLCGIALMLADVMRRRENNLMQDDEQ